MLGTVSEVIVEDAAFRAAFKKRRCLVLADGFFEWKKTPEGKQPMYTVMSKVSNILRILIECD